MQSEHSGLRPDTSSLVSFQIKFCCKIEGTLCLDNVLSSNKLRNDFLAQFGPVFLNKPQTKN